MCGITGICVLTGDRASKRDLFQMTDAIAHRGPDDEGQHIDGPVGLGNRRLAILDLSEAGHQPMPNVERTVWLTYNGEIYNYRELRRDLERNGYRFRSDTDTEVVLRAYEAWGPSCVERFNGMFAFAIWDTRARQLFLARDRYGIKPLYYYRSDSVFLFGSEVKSFLSHPEFTVDVDPQALLEYFTFQNVLSDRTLFEGVRLLPPGYTATLDIGSGRFEQRQYWDFDFREPTDGPSDIREYEEELHRLFRQAVERQLVSDVTVGSYLSGGMDSGAITAVATQTYPHLATFTGGFDLSSASEYEQSFDERHRSEALANRFGTEHYEVVMKATDMERAMPSLIWHLEDPRVGQCYPNYYVARLASRFCKVVLAGTGGDELFGGYPWRYYRMVTGDSLASFCDSAYAYWQRLIPEDRAAEFFQPHVWERMRDVSTQAIFRNVFRQDRAAEASTPEDWINLALYFEAKTFLHGLFVVEDKLSMAQGLETRVPFLDNDLVDFAMQVPVRAKLRELDRVRELGNKGKSDQLEQYFGKTNDGKLLLRRVLGRYMPSEYVDGIKQGFSAPDASWFQRESSSYVYDTLVDKSAHINGFLGPDAVRGACEAHLSGKSNMRLLIWSLLSYEWWLRAFYDD